MIDRKSAHKRIQSYLHELDSAVSYQAVFEPKDTCWVAFIKKQDHVIGIVCVDSVGTVLTKSTSLAIMRQRSWAIT